MKNNFALFQNPCRDVALQRLYIQIHTLIQQHNDLFRYGAIAESSSWLALWKPFMSYLRSLHLLKSDRF
ncbi:MAG: hypothetical protein V7L27_10515 [Nostoc sp.]|uniref:hypothetical protein n=1 Tax=Nostoc sp. TaxID=1180 RepID=UPI002FFA9632